MSTGTQGFANGSRTARVPPRETSRTVREMVRESATSRKVFSATYRITWYYFTRLIAQNSNPVLSLGLLSQV